MACVNVCPMGIDIRDGQQLECITCALCIDACDDVMDKIGKPRGLIDYIALSDEPRERAGKRAPAPDLEARLPPAHDPLHLAVVAGGHRARLRAVHPLGHRHDGGAGAQPDLRDAVGRVDPQHLRRAAAQQAWRGPALPRDGHGRSGVRVQLEGTPYETVEVPANQTAPAAGLCHRAAGSEPGGIRTAPTSGSGSRTSPTATAPTTTRFSTGG
jgi:hypothetical protein